jgi:hypothetical protein
MIRNEVFDSKGVCVSATVIDLVAGTIAFEELGAVKSTRALTGDEVTLYTPPAPVVTADEKLAAIKAQLDQIAALPAPVLTADVVDILDDIRQEL